jgi:uncharacterized protein (DUF1501 family)
MRAADTNLDASRRRFLAGLGATAMLTLYPRYATAAAPADNRLLVVLLRGAMDGLHLLPPIADPGYARARGAIAVADALKLDGSFGLHPKLSFAHGLYAQKQLLPVLAVAPPYRQRSHFDAQDCLENGTDRPGGARDGWIGRCIGAMSGTRTNAAGVAIAQVMPLAMRGASQSEIWSPPLPRAFDDEMLRQLQPLYAADSQLAAVFADAMQTDEVMPNEGMLNEGMLSEGMLNEGMLNEGMAGNPRRGQGNRFALPQAMAAAAKLMHGPDGMRIAFVEDTGWDTHRGQIAALDRKFGELDAGLRAVRDGLATDWNNTVVVVVTEFGRTVAVNGSAGTDHGVGGNALLAGGAVHGGRIAGDWPGLGAGQLLDGRDLRPTIDMRALFKGVLAAHLRTPEAALERTIFPGSAAIRPLSGLVVG